MFKINEHVQDKEQTIHYLANLLKQYNYVNDDFEQKILEREELSSTAFDCFAIPHSLTMEANQTGIAIMINPKGIIWQQHRVILVMMLCFSPNQRSLFNKLFEPLTNILTQPTHFEKIITSQNHDEFINHLVNAHTASFSTF